MSFNVGDRVMVLSRENTLAEYSRHALDNSFQMRIECIVLKVLISSIGDNYTHIVGWYPNDYPNLAGNGPNETEDDEEGFGERCYWYVHQDVMTLLKAKEQKIYKPKSIICRACGTSSSWIWGTSKKSFVCSTCRVGF